MGRYFAQVTLLSATGNTRDNQVNGFAAGQIGTLDAAYANSWTTAIKDFYDDLKAGNAMRGLATGPHLIKFYDIENPPPNYPVFERTFNFLTSGATVEMPQEVALCISYQNTSAVTVPRARRRGRIYISGWTESANTDGRPISANVNSTLTAFSDYVEAFNAIGTLEASIWSRVNGTTYPIETAWVDNEWDTMRSRGGRATSRSTWTLP